MTPRELDSRIGDRKTVLALGIETNGFRSTKSRNEMGSHSQYFRMNFKYLPDKSRTNIKSPESVMTSHSF